MYCGLRLPPASTTQTYAVANELDQYPSVDGQTLTWDGRGNLTAYAGLSLSYDSANRLVG